MLNVRAFAASVAMLAIVSIFQAACSSSTAEQDDGDPLTFAQAIEPLVQEKCQSCHREGGIAPFPLVTYEDVKGMGEVSKDKVQRREMPPWGAFDDPSCKMEHAFRDDLRLSDEQVDTFVRWVEKGMPLGDPAKRPPPRTTFGATGLVDKTASYQLPARYSVVPGKDDIRCFPIDPGFAEDTWVGGSNVVPGDPRVVHHVIVYVDPKRQGVEKAAGAGSYPCFGGPDVEEPSLLLAWAPGVRPIGLRRGDRAQDPEGLAPRDAGALPPELRDGDTIGTDEPRAEDAPVQARLRRAGHPRGERRDARRVRQAPSRTERSPHGPRVRHPFEREGAHRVDGARDPEKAGDITVPELGCPRSARTCTGRAST